METSNNSLEILQHMSSLLATQSLADSLNAMAPNDCIALEVETLTAELVHRDNVRTVAHFSGDNNEDNYCVIQVRRNGHGFAFTQPGMIEPSYSKTKWDRQAAFMYIDPEGPWVCDGTSVIALEPNSENATVYQVTFKSLDK